MTGKLISICPELCFPLAGFMMQNIPESSTNAYSTNINVLTVKILGISIYELTKSGSEYFGKSIGIHMGAVCGICMALSVIIEEIFFKVKQKQKRR